MMNAKFEIKTEMLGPERRHQQQVRVLNRVISWTKDGLQYEGDQRHAEIVIEEPGLKDAKAVSTPGTRSDAAEAGSPASKVPLEEDGQEEVKLNPVQAARYRAITARLNYLAQDRPDMQ